MSLKIQEKSITLFILTTGLILNYIFDGINKISVIYFPSFSRIAIFYRMLLEILCIITIILFLNRERVKFLLLFFYFTICFFIGNIYLKFIGNVNINLVEQFIYFNKYFFIFFIFFATYKILQDKYLLNIIIEKFKKIFLFNGFLATLGFVFKITLFDSTPTGTPRFGYDGLILAQNEASIFYLLALFVFYYDWKYKKVTNKVFLLVILFCFLTGMKAVLVGLVLLGIYHLIITVDIKKIKYIVLGSVLIPIILINSISKLKVLFGYYYYFLVKKGFVFMLLGGRNTFFESRIIPFLKKWGNINYLIGGQNISKNKYYSALTEMDFIDLLLFFGIINAILFFIIYKKIIIGTIKSKYFLFVISVFMLLAFFSGHFFTSSANPIYILVVFSYLKFINNEFYKKKQY